MPFFIMESFRFEVGKIICFSDGELNGGEIEQLDSEEMYIKPPSSISHDEGTILIPKGRDTVSFRPMMSMGIGKKSEPGSSIGLRGVLGYGLLMDITDTEGLSEARTKGRPWVSFKGRDSFCPVSVFSPARNVGDPYSLELYIEINGEERIKGSTKELILGLEEAIEKASSIMTLHPGDIVAVAFKGIGGALSRKERLEGGISSVGVLRVDVN